MACSGKLFLLSILGSIFLPENVYSQGYFFKSKDVNHYEIKNGKYRIIPTTTPAPTVIETFFPWTGSAFVSVRTPEEDAAILQSISDPEPPPSNNGPTSSSSYGDGIMSWIHSIPGFGSSSDSPSSQSNYPPPNYPPPGYPPYGYPPPSYPPPPPPNYPPPPMNYMPPMNMIGAASQIEPVVVPPPGAENQLGIMFPPPPLPPMAADGPLLAGPPPPPMQQIPPSPSQMPSSLTGYNMPQIDPTFQFHQQVKDSIPIPSPSLPGFGPSMFPYPYSSGGGLDFMKSTTEKSPSILEVISNYFQFGKRSDVDGETTGESVMQARSMDAEDEYETEEVEEEEISEGEPVMKEASQSEEKDASADGKFPCPKGGIWRWNGEVCIAVGPVPIWACRPNDLMVSGKIAVCRNKIYFSPKVITNIKEN